MKKEAEDVVAKEALGWSIGAAASVGLIKGESFSQVVFQLGEHVVITTPFGFKLVHLIIQFLLGLEVILSSENMMAHHLIPSFVGLGGNLT